MQRKMIPFSVQFDAKLVAEIEAYVERFGIGTPEQAIIKALDEFFREHRNCKRDDKAA
jgi:metal-responsive CopG/Arc/MetJ family transcriptional regulator